MVESNKTHSLCNLVHKVRHVCQELDDETVFFFRRRGLGKYSLSKTYGLTVHNVKSPVEDVL